jgi:hypothetical protein
MSPTAEKLTEARTWIENNEFLVNSGKPLPSGRLGQVVEILETLDAERADPVVGRT